MNPHNTSTARLGRPLIHAVAGAGVADKLYEARELARSILGWEFEQRMAELGRVVSSVAERRRCGSLRAAESMVMAADLQGFAAIQLFAAAVELEEPSTPPEARDS